jgi:hypothetical protein
VRAFGLLSPPQSPSDVRIEVSVGLKGELQASLRTISFLTLSRRAIISAGIG